jgi:hypothetical protein
MIDVKDIAMLVGRRVVSGYGVLGTIVEITDDKNPIKVRFDNGNIVSYSETGSYDSTERYHITLADKSNSIETVISEAMVTFGLTPEELIAIILERHHI